MKQKLLFGLGVVLIIALAFIGIGLFANGSQGGLDTQGTEEGSPEQQQAQATDSPSHNPDDVATGEATIGKVRIALNGKEDSRPEFVAFDDIVNDLKAEHYDVKSFDHHPAKSDNWQTTLRSLAASDADFIVAGTGQLAPWINEVATANPNKYWVTWDTNINLPNVTNIQFDNQRGAWLAGRVAGLATTDPAIMPSANPNNRIIGVVAAFPGLESDAYVNGFRDGAKSVHADMDVRVIYTNSHVDGAQAFNAADKLYKDGANVVFSLVGKGQEGVLRAARSNNKDVITVGTEDTKEPTAPVIATLERPLRRELVELITSNNPQAQRTVSIGVNQDDIYLEVRPDLNPKLTQAVDDQIEAWDKEAEK